MTPQYSTMLFCDVWDEAEDFVSELADSPFAGVLKQDTPEIIFYLLYSRYGNNPIANRDVNQFKMKTFSLIWQYGPSWEKRLDIQKKLRELQDDEIMKGSKQIHNHAYNPETTPGTGDTTELPYINEQNTSHLERSKMDAYAMLWNLIDTDVTSEFLMRFKGLFKTFVTPERPLIYVTEYEEEGDEEDEEQ